MKENVIRANVRLEVVPKAVIYPRNEEQVSGGFCIFQAFVKELTEDNKPVPGLTAYSTTLRGNVPEIIGGQKYIAIADQVEDVKYGKQYMVHRMNTVMDWSNTIKTKRFLGKILAPSYVEALYDTLGDPIPYIQNRDIETLCSVKGIGEAVAERIINRYYDSQDNAKAYSELGALGLTERFIDKLVETYHSVDTACEKVAYHTYSLIKDVRGVGWTKADELAKRVGIAPTSPQRLRAYLNYYLTYVSDTMGATFMPYNKVVLAIKTLGDEITDEMATKAVEASVKDGEIMYDTVGQRVGLMSAFRTEENIAKEIARLAKSEVLPINSFAMTLKRCEERVGYAYSDEQQRAMNTILHNGVSVLTAKAGCGKSASMFPIVSAMLDNGYTVGQCCLSGRAALNLTEYTGLQGMTIHRMLNWVPGRGFTRNETNQLPYDMIILDEVSMVGGEIFLALLKAIKTGARLVMVGDFGQLEPIGIGNVGHDIVKSGVIPHAHLTKIFRQAQASGIITESSKVYEGQSIVPFSFLGTQIRGQLQDFKLMSCANTEECFKAVISEYKRIHNVLGIPVEDITVCGAKRALGPICTRVLNDEIQKLVEPTGAKSIEIKYKDGDAEYTQTFRLGDRVSVVENSYQTKNIENHSSPIFNGNVGTVVGIDDEGKSITIRFNHDTIVIPKVLFTTLRLGYAITTHRAQGIGVPYVIAVVDPSARTLLSKELVYTQITRAKKFCTLIGTPEAINYATNTTRVQHKPTWLAELIQKEMQN